MTLDNHDLLRLTGIATHLAVTALFDTWIEEAKAQQAAVQEKAPGK